MRRAIVGTLVAGTAAFVGIGVLHTPIGLPVLSWMAGGECPVGKQLPPEAREVVRKQLLAPLMGATHAADRSVDGLSLGTTTRAEVAGWAVPRGATCSGDASAQSCTLPNGNQTFELGFDPAGRLVSVVLATTTTDPASAAAQFVARASDLDRRAGPAATSRGEPTGSWLGVAALRQASQSYRFSDYRVELTATNLGHERFLVRETHQVL